MGGERGLTLIEMVVAMAISLIVLGSTVVVLTVFLKDTNSDTTRYSTQDSARRLIDRLSRELRNAATPVNNSNPSALSAGLLEKATSYDIAFVEVSAAGTPPSSDVTNEMQVRYCLDSSNTLWRQATVPSSTYTTLPDTTSCPSTSSSWVTTSSGAPCCVELSDVTNEIGGNTTRPLFSFSPTGWTSTAQIKQVQIDLYVDQNPGKPPGPTEISSGVDLRNELSNPVAAFAVSQTKLNNGQTNVLLNGSLSSDANGQTLSYQWYTAGSCPQPSGSVVSTSQQPQLSYPSNSGSQAFLLVVTDTAGLSNCQAQTVTIQ